MAGVSAALLSTAVTWTRHVLSTCLSTDGCSGRSQGLCFMSGAAVNSRSSLSSHLTLPDSIVLTFCPVHHVGDREACVGGQLNEQGLSGILEAGGKRSLALGVGDHLSSPPAIIWILTCLPSVLRPSTHLTVAVRGHIMPRLWHPECQWTQNKQRTCTHTPNSEVDVMCMPSLPTGKLRLKN